MSVAADADSQPILVGQVPEMHLGMTRGPQLASSRDFSMVAAIDKEGNIHSFRLTHKTGTWEKAGNINDLAGVCSGRSTEHCSRR